jgi:hypothetical protein
MPGEGHENGARENGGDPRGLAERLHPAAKREERLTALAELYAGGALSQAEYELHRNEVLDEI